jgi:hypothetical protein
MKDYDDLTNFDFKNAKRDKSINLYENTYPISLGINNLKYQKKEEFFELYAEKNGIFIVKIFSKIKKMTFFN